MTVKEKHDCKLQSIIPSYHRIPPNAHIGRRFIAKLKCYWTLNPQSPSIKHFYRNKSTMLKEQRRHATGEYFFIIHPFSVINEILNFLFFVFWTYEIVTIPAAASFNDFDVTRRNNPKWKISWDYVLFPFQITLILSKFFSGYVEPETKNVVLEPKKILKKYVKSYLIFDLLSITVIGDAYYYTINMCCYARLIHVRNYYVDIMKNLNVSEKTYECVLLLVETFLFINFFTCFFYYSAAIIYKGQIIWPSETWFFKAAIDPVSKTSSVEIYFTCTLLIVCHFFGAGTGWFYIENIPSERLILSIVMFVGRLWTLFVMAKLLWLFRVLNISDNKYDEYIIQLKVYMKQKNLPKELREQILEYYLYKYQRHFFDETKILHFLSNYIREELLLWQARKLIQNVQLFKLFPKSVTGSIIGCCQFAIYMEGDTVVKAGDEMNTIFFIASGAVAVSSEDNTEVAHMQDGDQFGLTSAITPERLWFRFNYTAIETTEIYYIRSVDFKKFVGNEDDILKFFSHTLEERFQKFQRELGAAKVGRDVLSELSSGKILEMPRKRQTVHM